MGDSPSEGGTIYSHCPAPPGQSLPGAQSLSVSKWLGPWRRGRRYLWTPTVTVAAQDSMLSPSPHLALQLLQVSAGFFLVTGVALASDISPWKALSSLGFQAIWLPMS